MHPFSPTKICLTLFLCISLLCTRAQKVDSLYLRTIYNRCLDFDETKADSLLYYANYINEQSKLIHLGTGSVLSLRLVAIYTEMQGEYDSATVYYLKTLEEAERLGNVGYEISALSDLCDPVFKYQATRQVKGDDPQKPCPGK